MNIVITGGNGFIGTNLAKKFSSKGHKVFLLDFKSKLKKTNIHKNIKYFKTDITSLNSLKKSKFLKTLFYFTALVNRQQPYHFINHMMIIKKIS